MEERKHVHVHVRTYMDIIYILKLHMCNFLAEHAHILSFDPPLCSLLQLLQPTYQNHGIPSSCSGWLTGWFLTSSQSNRLTLPTQPDCTGGMLQTQPQEHGHKRGERYDVICQVSTFRYYMYTYTHMCPLASS